MVELDLPIFMQGKTIIEADIRSHYGILIAAIRYANGKIEVAPNVNSPFKGDERLIVIGDPERVQKFEEA